MLAIECGGGDILMGARAGAKIVLRCPHAPISPRRPPLIVGRRVYEECYAQHEPYKYERS